MKIEIEEATTGRIAEEQELQNRHNFLRSLGKWSLAVICCATTSTVHGSSKTAWLNMGSNRVKGAAAARRADRDASWVNGGNWIDRGVTVDGGEPAIELTMVAREPGKSPRSLGAIS